MGAYIRVGLGGEKDMNRKVKYLGVKSPRLPEIWWDLRSQERPTTCNRLQNHSVIPVSSRSAQELTAYSELGRGGKFTAAGSPFHSGRYLSHIGYQSHAFKA